jgi:2-(1,2-epoxy-1,2-dihydrophenyl)acetyl-CoA isomerase
MMNSSNNLVTLSVGDAVMTVCLNRPERANALSRAGLTELRAALEQAAGDAAVRVVLLKSSGKAFSSGADVGEEPGKDLASRDLGESLERYVNPVIQAIRELPKPVVVAVQGLAAGAGCSLALAGDIVVAGRSARFHPTFARFGLVPDAGASYLLPRLAGSARAKGMSLLAQNVTAEQASAWGMIWDTVDDAELEMASHQVAVRLVKMPPLAQGWIKQLLHAAETNTMASQLGLERDLQRLAGRSADFREAIAAFREKRPARFTGQRD